MAADDGRDELGEQLSQQIAERWDPDRLTKVVVGEAGRGEKLEHGLRSEMERRLGADFSNVRVMRGPFAEAITRRHRADAVTVANTGLILVREGPRSNPRTALGKALLAHELTHVRQAQRGLHFAHEGGQGSDAPHEREAERVESEVHDEALSAGGENPVDREVRHELVIARVLELIKEEERSRLERLGLDD